MLQNKIKSLINIIEGTEINELEVSSFWGAQKIRLQKNINGSIQPTLSPPLANIAESNPTIKPSESEDLISSSVPVPNPSGDLDPIPPKSVEITAPLVGTFYQSSKPESPPFVKEGDNIKVGEIICIIEAMKIFNEIESEVSGKVIKIIPADSSPVEYGQLLMLVEPS